MRKIFFLVLITQTLLNAVTVAEAGVAYGKLDTALAAFNASALMLTQTQKKVNKELKKQLKSLRALNYATANNTEKYKNFSGVMSSYVDLQAANIKMGTVRNETSIVYSKALNQKLEKDDILQLLGK